MNLYPSKTGAKRVVFALCTIVCFIGQINMMAAPGSTPVRDVDNGLLNPMAIEVAWFSGTTSGFTETSSYSVPADKRLEITEISCEAYAPGNTQVMMKITMTAGGHTMTHYVTGFASSLIYSNYWILGMTSHHLFVDPGSTITIDVVRQSPAGPSIGYYSDVILTGRMTSL